MPLTQNNRTHSGFTLLEIMVTMIIIATVMVLAFPRYQIATEKMRSQEGTNLLYSIFGSHKRYTLDTGTEPTALSQLDIEIPDPDNFQDPSLSTTAGIVATISRQGSPSYTLSISDQGDIGCSGSICSKLGY